MGEFAIRGSGKRWTNGAIGNLEFNGGDIVVTDVRNGFKEWDGFWILNYGDAIRS